MKRFQFFFFFNLEVIDRFLGRLDGRRNEEERFGQSGQHDQSHRLP